MIEVNPARCMRTAEELSDTGRVLFQQTDVLSGVCRILRNCTDESMHAVAETIERYISDIEHECRAADTISLMLEKIAESYLTTERDSKDFIEQVYIAPVRYGTIVLGDMTMKTRELFEEY